MEDLNKMGKAGLSFFDTNMEYLGHTKWEDTPLGHRDSWCQPLISFVNLLATLPHPAAVFWGKELTMAHNLAWAEASDTKDRQGLVAKELFEGEGLNSLQTAMRGRTVTVASEVFLQKIPEKAQGPPVLLSPVLGEDGARAGIFAQFLQVSSDESGMDEDHEIDLGSNEEDEKQDLSNEGNAKENGDKFEDGNTQEDSKQYEEDQKARGKDPDEATDKPREESNGQGIHMNDKPGKNPILKHGDSKINLKQNRLFRRFAQMLPTGLAILDKQAEAMFVNDNFFSLTSNKTHKSFRAWPESIHPDDYDRVMKEYKEAFSSHEGMRTEFRCNEDPQSSRNNNNDPWRLFLMKPLNDEPEQGGFIVAVVDITDMKAAELSQRRLLEEAKERKVQQERFVDMISHEIRNPLSAILHSTEEIRDTVKKLDQKSEAVLELLDATDTILLCVAHQSSLVDEILQFSKLDAAMLTLTPKACQPKWALSEVLKVFGPELRNKNIKFHYAMDISFQELKVDWVLADLKRIKQVVVNLMTNAIKFTAKKKGDRNISVAVGATLERPTSYPPSVVFFSDNQGPKMDATLSSEWASDETFYLMVAVKDNGIGISEDGQAKLFERFRQATPKTQEKYGGSGLGLFISRKLCQLHGGDIGVSSKEGHGSTFGFFFRVSRSGPPMEDGDDDDDADNLSLSETASQQVEARSRASSVAHDNTTEEIPNSLVDPPTEYREEAHPGVSTDIKHDTTAKIAKDYNTDPEVEVRSESHRNSEPDVKPSPPLASSASKSSRSKRSNGNAILLAEDNIINQKVLRRQLQSKGYVVTPANNGKEAVEAVEEASKNSTDPDSAPFDCILMDQEMPTMTGNAATRAIRQLEKDGHLEHIPVLGVSANVREEQKQEMIEAGMDDVITKPFKVDDLVKKIKELLAGWDEPE